MKIAKVVIDISSKQLNPIYDYLIPSYLANIKKGIRVVVPFGKSDTKRVGYLIDIVDLETHNATKEINKIIDYEPIINDETFEIIDYLDKTNIAPLYSVIKTIIPNELKFSYERKYYKNIDISTSKSYFDRNGKLKTEYYKEIPQLLKNNTIYEEYVCKQKKEISKATFYSLMDDFPERFYFIYPGINDLSISGEYTLEYLHSLDLSDSNIKTMLKHGVLKKVLKDKEYQSFSDIVKTEKKNVTLNNEQQNVYNDITKYLDISKTIILKGVTGSGKTEIYIKLMEKVILQKKNIIILTPEITLITPLVARILSSFENVSVFHSLMSSGERLKGWIDIKNNKTRIIIGTRSACFLPLNNVGLLIMDEEHDKSYTQNASVSYDTLDIMKLKSIFHNCPLILGSATPKISTYYSALNDEYALEELKIQAMQSNPSELKIVDMTESNNFGKILSPYLVNEIDNSLRLNHQVVILHTIKGSYKYLHCEKCGFVYMCPHCDVTLTHYKASNSLRCHYCGYSTEYSEFCPNCGDILKHKTYGIESVLEELNHHFPDVRILRADTNLITTKSAYEKIYLDFKEHKYDILLGTQMISKGLDFPDVDLAGIINADYIINTPSYDSFESAYVLMRQLGGRSGRFYQGKTIIQTTQKNNISITSLSKPYEDFYYKALEFRKIGMFSPFYHVSQIVLFSKNKQDVFMIAKEISKQLRKNKLIRVLGPNMAIIPVINNELRVILTIKALRIEDLRINEIKTIIFEYIKKYRDTRIHFYPFYQDFI